MPTNNGFIAILLTIGLMVVLNSILFFRSYIRPSNGKASYNERQKYVAGAMDRAATACLVAGFVTPQTRLSDLMLNVDNQTKSMITLLIWILAAVGLHLLGAMIVARVKD